jgi:hypothetical protein
VRSNSDSRFPAKFDVSDNAWDVEWGERLNQIAGIRMLIVSGGWQLARKLLICVEI